MEELQKLYDVLVREGKYTKSFEEFQSKWAQDEAYKNKVYDVVSRDGLYTKDKESFFQKYSALSPKQQTSQQEPVAEKPVVASKKKFALDSSSEVGSSELPKYPKKKFSVGDLQEQPNIVSRDATFVKEPKIKISKKEIKNIEERAKEEEALRSEKKKYGDMFDKQLNIKPKVEQSQYLKDRLSAVNTELINKEEEYVVPELEYQFGDLGFKFEESGATGDFVKVTAPNGKTTEISLDNFLDSKSKKQSDLLQNFIKDNAPAKGLFVLEKTMREQDKKFNSQKQVDESIKGISAELSNLNNKQKQFLAKKAQFDKELKALGPNPDKESLSALEQQRLALKSEMDSLIKEEENIKQKSKKLDTAVGKYSIAKSKQGTWGGGIWNAIWEGVGSIDSALTSLMIDIAGEVNPIVKDSSFKSQYLPALFSNEDATKYAIEGAEKMGLKVPTDRSQESINKFKQSLTQDQLDQIESYVRDKAKKLKKEEMLPVMRIGGREIFGDADTTKQWSNLKEQDFWGGAILGLSKSLPAMIGGAGPAGWAQRTAQMYAQVSDGLAQEMEQDPDFKDISENEKLAITLPIGIVGAVLEEVGLKNIKGSQGVINKIALNVLGKAGKGVTAKTFRELVENEVDGMLSKGLLTITAAGAAEFETGAAQELADTGFKAVYNEIKGKEMFDTPESTTDLIENVLVSGAQEAVGGFVLGVPTAVSTAFTEKGFLKMDDATFDTFANMANDENMQSAYIATLKDKITRGELTTSEAKDQLNNYRNSVGLFRQLPDGLSTRQKKEAMNLLKEKRDLENYVNGKDPALVVKQKNRISEINDSLTKLSETEVTEEKVPFEMLQDDESAKLKIQAAEELKQEALSKGIKEEEINISEKEINNKAKENYAVQIESTTEIPVQSETGISETVAEGISEPKPEVITEQGTQEEVTQPQTEVTQPQTIIEEQVAEDAAKPSFEEIMEKSNQEVEAIQKEVDDFDSKNREYKGKSKKELESELRDAKDKLFDSQKNISRAEDPDAAIEEYNKSKEKVSEIEKQIENINNFKEVTNLIFDEVDASKKPDYEYKEIFDKDPRLASIQSYKDLLEFLEGRNDEKDSESIARYKNYIKILEQDIKDNPLKENTLLSQKAEPQVVSEQISVSKEYDSDNENNEENMSVLSKVLDKEGIVPPAEPMILESGNLVSVTYRGQDFDSPETTIIFNKKKNGAWSIKGYRVETTTEPQVVSEKAVEEVNELLELDTKDKDGLQRVLDYLDRLDSSLDLDPNELNDVTRVMAIGTAKAVVKTLKALVKAGITLKEAINTASEIHSVDTKDVLKAFDVIKQGDKQKSAPSPLRSDIYAGDGRIISIVKDVKKITMREKDLLAKQLRDKARGARESIQKWKKQTKQLTEDLDELARTGKISVEQSSAILKKFAKVNIFSRKSVDRFTDYMVKVISKADYANKLSEARKTLSSIKSLSKDDKKNADLRAVGSEFAKIEPSMVENIEEYNDIASKLKTAIDGSKARGKNVKIVDTVNIDEVSSYIDKTLAEQEEKLQQEKINEIQDLLGVDASEFSAEEIDAMLESEKDLPEDNEKIVRATIKKAFDIYSSVIKEMLSTGKDPFTDEDVSFTDKEKDLIERFMGIDVNTIKDSKEALRMVDSLINFIQNKSTAGMLKPIADFEYIKDSDKIVKKGIKAIRLRKYFSPKIGRSLGQKTTTLPVLFEKMFKGVNRALEVEEAIGVSDLINNASKAESEVNSIVKQYTKEFYDKKANGESYNSLYNDIERGVFAHVNRNVIGNKERQKSVFDKRKQEVLDTINVLENSGNDSEVELAKAIRKAYDKILDGSESINDVRTKTDAENIKGVEFWINKWDSKYEALSDLAKDFYNKILGRDLGYTPDRIVKLQDKRGDVELEDIQSQFLANTDEILYDKKSGSLMDKQENRNIPKDMYIDFSFDKKNSNAMYDALTDLYTAFDIRKVGAFLKSDNFKKIFPSRKDASLIDKRIKNFVRITRRKTPYSSSELSDILRYADKIAKLGVTASLASVSQPFKQTVPVMTSTLINAGSLGMGANLSKGYNEWLNNIGYAISNRGADAQVEIESINKLIDKAADMPAEKALKYIEDKQDKLLKIMLANPDIWIARASFKAYYEQSLKRQGKKSSGIDYTKHKVNKEAANYAQRMVDRQQNISNKALAGDLYTSESDSTKILIKMLAPFSSFRMNQASRLGSDLTTLEYWNTSTKEDKIIALRSIAGYAVESATFRALQIGVSLLMYNLGISVLGGDSDDEEDEKYVKNLLKGSGTSAFLDTFSPLPTSDPLFQDALSSGVDIIESYRDIPEEEKLKLFGSQEQSALKILGTYGIAPQRAKEIFELGKLAYTEKYKDKYGKEKEISSEDANALKNMVPILIASSVTGFASPDVSSISKGAIRVAKQKEQSIDPNLGIYSSKKEMKEKDPRLYKRTFGKGSLYYRQKKRESKIKKREKKFGLD